MRERRWQAGLNPLWAMTGGWGNKKAGDEGGRRGGRRRRGCGRGWGHREEKEGWGGGGGFLRGYITPVRLGIAPRYNRHAHGVPFFR